MKIIKKILKVLLVIFIGLVLAAAILPYVFKDKIIEGLRTELNNSLNAEVTFRDVDISFFSSFPDVGISIDSLKVTGIDSFAGVHFLDIAETDISVSLPSFINNDEPYRINSISAHRPTIYLEVSRDSLENWDIFKESKGDSVQYVVELDEYNITNGQLTYVDHTSGIVFTMEDVTHSGNGSFTPTTYDLNTNTLANKINLTMAGMTYIHNAAGHLDAIVNVNVPDQKYTLKENKLEINELSVVGEGDFRFVEDGMLINLDFHTPSDDFKSFFSVIPYAYTENYKDVETMGTAILTGKINGMLNESTNPSFNFNLKIQSGFVKYPNLPKSINDINAVVLINAGQGDYSDMSVDIPSFSMTLDNEVIRGDMAIKRATGMPSVKGSLNGRLNLAAWEETFPGNYINDLSGVIDMDLSFNARLDDVQKKNYNNISLNGEMMATNLNIRTEGMPAASIKSTQMTASPQQINVTADEIHVGNSRMNAKAVIINPLSYFTQEGSMEGSLLVDAENIDMNEFTQPSGSEAPEKSEAELISDYSLPPQSALNLDLKADRIIYQDHLLQNARLKGGFRDGSLNIDDLAMKMNDSDISISGKFDNVENYLFNNETLTGGASVKSSNLDLNPFMTNVSGTSEKKVILIPENIDVTVDADITRLSYTNYELNNFTGNLDVENQTAELTNVRTRTMGGEVSFEGMYSTINPAAPNFSFKFDMSQISFVEAFKNISTLNKLAPIVKYLEGIFNSTLVMSGNLGDDMMPDISTLDASGYLETLNGNLAGDNPLHKIGSKLGIDALTKISLERTRNWFEIVDGMVELKPVDWNVKGIQMKLGGSHGLGKDLKYYINMAVPRILLEKNQITALASEGISFFEKQAAKLGLNVEQGGDIIFDVNITGNLSSPNISIRPAGISGASADNVVKDAIDNKIKSVKDSLTNEANKAKQKAIDSLKNKSKTAVDSVKTVIDQKVNNAVDSVKNKLEKEVKEAVTDTLKNTAGDILKDVIKNDSSSEIDSIKNKLDKWNPFKKKKKKDGGN